MFHTVIGKVLCQRVYVLYSWQSVYYIEFGNQDNIPPLYVCTYLSAFFVVVVTSFT